MSCGFARRKVSRSSLSADCDVNRTTTGRIGRSYPSHLHPSPPERAAPAPEDADDQRVTIVPVSVWAAGIAAVAAVVLLSA